MRFWFDTEFIEDGRTIDLISIGMVSEDGRHYYAESAECDLSRASQWVRENVFPQLTGVKKPRAKIASDLVDFCGDDPQFWAFYADYDWVAICQLYGTMMQLPFDWPRYCLDIKQLMLSRGVSEEPRQIEDLHNALADAKWAREIWLKHR
jgi:hypothetical protein